MRREHFNRWYSTGSYYLATFLTDVPIVLVCSTIFVIIIYVLTDQPMEDFRFFNFLLIGILTTFIAQAHGLLIGSMFNIKVIRE